MVSVLFKNKTNLQRSKVELETYLFTGDYTYSENMDQANEKDTVEKSVLDISYIKEPDLPTVFNIKSSLGEIFSSDDNNTFEDVNEPKESGFSLFKGVVSKTFNMFFPASSSQSDHQKKSTSNTQLSNTQLSNTQLSVSNFTQDSQFDSYNSNYYTKPSLSIIPEDTTLARSQQTQLEKIFPAGLTQPKKIPINIKKTDPEVEIVTGAPKPPNAYNRKEVVQQYLKESLIVTAEIDVKLLTKMNLAEYDIKFNSAFISNLKDLLRRCNYQLPKVQTPNTYVHSWMLLQKQQNALCWQHCLYAVTGWEWYRDMRDDDFVANLLISFVIFEKEDEQAFDDKLIRDHTGKIIYEDESEYQFVRAIDQPINLSKDQVLDGYDHLILNGREDSQRLIHEGLYPVSLNRIPNNRYNPYNPYTPYNPYRKKQDAGTAQNFPSPNPNPELNI